MISVLCFLLGLAVFSLGVVIRMFNQRSYMIRYYKCLTEVLQKENDELYERTQEPF